MRPEPVVYWIENSAERHISYKADFQSLEKARDAFLFINLRGGVEDSAILVKADYLEACLNYSDWVAHNR